MVFAEQPVDEMYDSLRTCFLERILKQQIEQLHGFALYRAALSDSDIFK
jgi:hypothetical protein